MKVPSVWSPIRIFAYQIFASLKIFYHNKKAFVGLIITSTFIIMAVFAPWIAPYNPLAFNPAQAWQPPSLNHLFGTNYVGQDIFSQFVWGARVSLEVGFLAGVVVQLLGNTLGLLAGYKGGTMDEILMRVVDIFLVLPSFPLLLLLVAFVPSRGPLTVAGIIVLTSWPGHTRNMRSQALSYKEREFVQAAKASGYSDLRIAYTEIFPNLISLTMAGMMYAVTGAIAAEAGLDFLGLASGRTLSWGTMLYWASSEGALLNGSWWWLVPPGLALATIGFALVMMNYAFDELFNPRLRTA
ncbi:MAG: ABC transporter permease [Thermoprotei archaeon]